MEPWRRREGNGAMEEERREWSHGGGEKGMEPWRRREGNGGGEGGAAPLCVQLR
jgi:hypothetical protein